jgi:hypothetical protein
MISPDLKKSLRTDIERAAVAAADNVEQRLHCLAKCRAALVEYRRGGGDRREAYDTVYELYKAGYDNDFLYDFYADVLDIIVGNIGNTNMTVWDEYLRT